MKQSIFRPFVLSFLGLACSASLYAKAEVGQAAPAFKSIASDGKTYSLSDFKGKVVVLEWYNTGCPFIRKHYDGGHMQSLQDTYGKKGVVWLSVASSAPGKEGYLSASEAQADRAKYSSKALATLLDPDGKIGRLYEAKTTPHMFIIDTQGKLIYNGAIDDHNSTDMEDIKVSKNYVSAALDEVLAGKAVSVPTTKPYGCSVKYQ